VYPKLLDDETWFPKYLKTQIETAFELDKNSFAREQFLSYIGKAPAFSKILVKIVVELYAERSANRPKKDSGRWAYLGILSRRRSSSMVLDLQLKTPKTDLRKSSRDILKKRPGKTVIRKKASKYVLLLLLLRLQPKTLPRKSRPLEKQFSGKILSHRV